MVVLIQISISSDAPKHRAPRIQVGTTAAVSIPAVASEMDLTQLHRLSLDEYRAPRPYHPATATLIVEVAVSSLQRDVGIKSDLYARAGVEEYWVLDLDGRRLVVQREPRPDGYGLHRAELDDTAEVATSALPLPPLPLAGLFAAATA